MNILKIKIYTMIIIILNENCFFYKYIIKNNKMIGLLLINIIINTQATTTLKGNLNIDVNNTNLALISPLGEGFMWIVSYNECVGVYDVLGVNGKINPTEPTFYIYVLANKTYTYLNFYYDSSCTKEMTESYLESNINNMIQTAAIYNKTTLENEYDVKIKYMCQKSNVATMYAKLGTSYINGKTYSIQETTMGSINGQQLIGYKIQLGSTTISGNEGVCLSNNYRFDKLKIQSSSQNSNTQTCPEDMHLDGYQCVCNNNKAAEDLNGNQFCYEDNDDLCDKLYTNAYWEEGSQYNCKCKSGYEFEFITYENKQIPKQCIKQTQNEYPITNNNKTCLNKYGQFAYFNEKTNECDCENDYILYDNQYCMEGGKYCKLMSPNEQVYHDSYYGCWCNGDKQTYPLNKNGAVICYTTFDELCSKAYPNSHYVQNGQYDINCECNTGYKEDQTTKKCVKIEDENSSIHMMMTLMMIILAILI